MKELSIEEKAKRYDEAIAKGRQIQNTPYTAHWDTMKEVVEHLFPELKNEDERIRTFLYKTFTAQYLAKDKLGKWHGEPVVNILSWFEKQDEKINIQTVNEVWKDMRLEVGAQASGNRHEPQYSDNSTKLFSLNDIDEIIEKISEKQDEQKTDDKIKAKQTSDLEKGKWYVCDTPRYRNFIVSKAYYCPKNEMLKLKEDELPRYVAKDCFHPWTIQDAKDGDVLATLDYILIFKKLLPKDGGVSYCHYDFGAENPQFIWSEDKNWYFGKEAIIHPATQEQRDLLFQKMKEAGYEWDAEKKELKKIEQKPAWSEEDEDMVDNIIKAIHYLLRENDSWGFLEDCLEWLKFLKERYTWKPSEQDILLLERIVNGKSNPQDFQASLGSLIGQLKKLK